MQEVRNWKLKKVIKVINMIADAKINQGVMLKEMVHSIQANQKDKSADEWRKFVFEALNKMLDREKEILDG